MCKYSHKGDSPRPPASGREPDGSLWWWKKETLRTEEKTLPWD